jgi:RHS repeat-associated protein
MYRIKAVLLIGLLLLSHIIFEDYEEEPVSVKAAQDVDVNVPPVVEIVPDVSSGKAPLTVHFDGNVHDEDGEVLLLEWDFEGDGLFESAKRLKDVQRSERLHVLRQGLQKEYIYTKPGIYHVVIRVTDDKGESAVSSVTIQVHSDRPYLDVVPCNNEFDYMAQAGYEAFFKSNIAEKEGVRFQMGNYWISYQWENQVFGEIHQAKCTPEGNMIWYKNVFSHVDIQYTVHDDLLLEELIVHQVLPVTVIEQSFVTHGVEYKMEDESIGFYNGEDLVFSIPPPVMYELNNPQEKSYGLHYEVVERENDYVLRKVIDDLEWLKTAAYPVVIDSSTQGELADPWEQQGLTPYGQYFKNMNEYVDPLTGHLTIQHTDYTLSGRGLDLSVTRVYSTVVAYKQEENGSGEYVPVATYQEAPTDLGYGWRLDFPWLEVDDEEPGKYMHLPNGAQVKTDFQNGTWENSVFGFTMVENADNTYTKHRKNGIKEEYDSEGHLTSITDLNGNVITFAYGQYGLSSITDTAGRVLNFSYTGGKLTSISDGVRTTLYNYSGDKLVAVTDPLGRVTSYDYLSGNSFLITGVHYPSGGFSSYEYGMVIPATGKLAPYKASESDGGEPTYYVYKVDSDDTVTWTSPKDINAVTVSGGRPCVLQRDDGSLVMYYKDTYVWTESVWKCYGGECWEEPITHTEYWIKQSVSTDQHHWSVPQNVVQVKSTTGNPVVIEKQDGSFVMYYKDKYKWTEQDCYWEGCPWDCQYICDSITHTEYWIYQRTSTDGLIWHSPVKTQQTTSGVKNIAVIQKQDTTYLMCYTDKAGSSYYIRQKTSDDGLSWSSPSTVVQVDSGTGNPGLLQRDSGSVYLAYKEDDNYIYVVSNSGSGWSSPVQTTSTAEGDPALLDTDSDIVIIFKGTDGHCYRISSSDGVTWSLPSQIAPNKIISDPATVARKDRFYRVTAQYISTSAADLVKVLEFSYEGEYYLPNSCDVLIRDAQTLKSSIHLEYDSKGRPIERISKDEQGVQTGKIVYTYNSRNKVIRQDVYSGASTDISYSVITGYDNKGNVIYTKDPEGAEYFYSYANTDCANQFVDSKGEVVDLFSNEFYTNSVPSNCHTIVVGEAFINNTKATETYYKYDTNGNLIEAKNLFLTRDYAVFSGMFDENTQTTFELDLTGLTITDGFLMISSIAVPTPEPLHETHSEPGKGWLNSGSWSGKYFLAEYLRCTPEPDCFDGETKIGPFEHCPGSPGYTGYTTWVEDNTQYVQANYSAVVNEYPGQTQYKLNSSSWTTITNNLGSGTTSTVIPASSFEQGLNTLQFQETNAYSTKFGWTLYIDQGASPEECITRFTFDRLGNVTSVTDAIGNATLYDYDSNHVYPMSVINEFNHTITATYDFNTGLAMSVTDAKGNTTSFEYDLLGRVTKRVHPDLSEVEAVYDDQNNTVTIYDELDHYVIRYYDGLSRLTKIEWYISPTTFLTETYTYNYLNTLETLTDPEGHTYSYEYDSLGRPTKTVNPDLSFRQIQYDDINTTITVLDENQHKAEYHYDWVGNLLWVREYRDAANYYLTQYTYDDSGNLTSVIDANGNTTFYDYDSLFGMTQIRYPDLKTETFSYDAIGNLLQNTDALGTTTFTYSPTYQLIEISCPDSSFVSFEYDANGNRTLMTDPEGQSSYVYDNRNRLLSETRTINGDLYTVSYAYDVTSQVLSTTYPDQTVVDYEYDPLERLTSVQGYAEFTYTADSLLESVTYGNSITTSYQYDNRNRPVSMQATKNDTDILFMNYQYDPVGNITHLNYERRLPDQQWTQSTEFFEYDSMDRLLSAQGDYGSFMYSYDPVGNRLSQNNLTYTYSSMNELISTNDGSVFTYDENGNTLSNHDGTDTWSYTYDTRNLLIQTEKNQQIIAQYTYDGDGNRIKKTEWIESLQEYHTFVYVYSGTDVIYEKNLTTDQKAANVFGPHGRIARNVGELTDYYHTDHLGSTRLITAESGSVVTDVSYTPFGESTLTGEEDRFLYTGKELDTTDLYYYGARYYDAQFGRFITRDPLKGKLESPQTLNRYTYCLNNPQKYIDPQGMDCEFVILPDGTISYEVADILNRLREALKTVDWDAVQSELAQGHLVEALVTILREIFPEAGFDVYADTGEINVILSSGYKMGFFWVDSLHPKLIGDPRRPPAYGACNPLREFSANIYLNKDLLKDAGDLFCNLAHELTHAYLSREFSQSDLLDMTGGREDARAYLNFTEAISYYIEKKIMSYISDDYLSESFKRHVEKEYAWVWMYYKLGPVYERH